MPRKYILNDLDQRAFILKAEVRNNPFGGIENIYTKGDTIWVKIEPIIAEQITPYSPASGILPSNPTYKVITNSMKNIARGDIIQTKDHKLKIFKIYIINHPFKMFITEEVE